MAESNNGHRAKILFVDDNPALLRSVERLLCVEGFQVALASNGGEALAHMNASTHLPDLIISDISMPHMDGFQLFESVRSNGRWTNIPFLFLTARDQRDDLRRGYALGVDDYLVKPFDHERLVLVIESKLKRHAELLEHVQTQQAMLETVSTDLSMMVAHELRTPLVSITMITDILAGEFENMDPEQMRDMLDTMQAGSVRLTRLVEQMAMFVQLQTGVLANAVARNARPFNVSNAIDGALRQMERLTYQPKSSRVEVEVHKPDCMIMGDSTSFQYALFEIIANALAFSEPDGVVVVEQWCDEHASVIRVTDQGPGIAPEDVETVFLPFRQINRQHYEQQGIGIGLPLAQGIMTAHGAQIDLESVVGQGTSVTVRIPAWTGASKN